MGDDGTVTSNAAESTESAAESKLRFEAELEFVQALANPDYLHYLAQNRFFDDPRFVDYIDYLQYWRQLPHCLYIVFPHSLYVLERLQNERFVAAIKRSDFKELIAQQQHRNWLIRADARREAPPPAPPAQVEPDRAD